jgi:regulator of sigma E protease
MLDAFLSNVGAVIVVLGIMIVVHELGHFLAAKLFGVRVEVFSVGFGKRLFGFRRGDTDYRLSAIPLGGYVKMSGENPGDERTGDAGEFSAHPRWQRFFIAVAGPAANILLAIVLLTAVFMVHYVRPYHLDQPAVLSHVLEESPAEHAGLQPGDRILRLENMRNPTWEDVELKVLLSPNLPLSLDVERNGEVIALTVTPTSRDPQQIPVVGWLPDQPNTITYADPDRPAYRAGIRPGDELVGLDGRPVRTMLAVQNYLQQHGAQPVEVAVVRDGKELHFTVTPEAIEESGHTVYRLGVASQPVRVERLAFAAAFQKSLETNRRYSLLIFELVGKMIRGQVSMKQIEGPIGIARISGQAARMDGWIPLLMLMALISLNLGIFNLFPIPILDGGVILLLLIESVMRRDISMQVKERIYQFSFLFLILFAGVVIYNDVVKMLPGLMR